MVLQTEYNVKKLFVIRRIDFRKPGLKTGVKKDIWNRLANCRIVQHTPIYTNAEDYAPLATSGKMSEFRFVTECSYGCLVFFGLKLHCGATAERRLDCKGLIIFLFCKFPWYQITHVWQWLQRRFSNLVSITLIKFVTGSSNNYWLYRYQSESRSAFGNISFGIISISRLAHFFFVTHL